jgi:HAD superfamily hydrolase (TIGR01509 family)
VIKEYRNVEVAKLVIFDLDGVLVDLKVNWEALKNDLKKYFSKNYGVVAELNPMDNKLDEILKKLDESARRDAYKIIESHELEKIENLEPIKKAIQLAKKFKKDGKKLAIFSLNTKKTVERSIELIGLKGYFDFIVAKEDVLKHKPNPEGLEKIVKASNLDKKDIVFIGDNQKDIETGKMAHINTILISDSEFNSLKWCES